jgi:hypothetical protein
MASRLFRPTEETQIDRVLVPGVLAGMAAALVAGIIPMVITAIQGDGFLRPTYRIAYLVVGDESRRSVEAALADDPFLVEPEMVFFGVVLHFFVGAFWGAVFTLVVRTDAFRQRKYVVAVGYALAVMVVMSVVVLPLAALVLGAGGEVAGFPGRLGWPAFVAMHVVYGLMLGWWRWYGPWGVPK